MERDLLHVYGGRAGHVKQELEELGPQVVVVLVQQVPGHLGHQVSHLLTHRLVGLLLQDHQEVGLKLGLLLQGKLRKIK